jgi:hypothetical protein
MFKKQGVQDRSASMFSKRTLPGTLDEIAKETPNRRHATMPVSNNLDDGFRDVSFGDIANGVNKFVYELEKLYGRSPDFETPTYLGIPDLRYVIVVYGAIKCGYKVSEADRILFFDHLT